MFPGSALDRIWALNPRAYAQLAPFGKVAGHPFLLLAIALAIAGAGRLKRKRWGWRLAVAILAAQFLGDFVNALSGRVLPGAIGLVVASLLLFHITREKIRAGFH